MERITRAKIKYLKGLREKKSRKESGLFLCEGLKMVQEGLKSGWICEEIAFSGDLPGPISEHLSTGIGLWKCKEEELREISSLENPEQVLAAFRIPDSGEPSLSLQSLVLDNVRDPGNMGTLLRTAAWFGVPQVVASAQSADLYNPKVLRSTMGSLFKLKVCYVDDLALWLSKRKDVWIADMRGESTESFKSSACECLVLGSESQGVSSAIRNLPGVRTVSIAGKGVESLNVAIAGGILMYEWKKG